MKIFAVAVVLALSIGNVYADEWSINSHGVAVVLQKEVPVSDKVEVMIVSSNGMSYIISGYDESYCNDRAMLVNNQAVNFESHFDESDNKYIKPHQCYYTPKTEKGAGYLFDAFAESNEVKVNGTNFSAIGFRKAIEQLMSLNEPI